MKPTPFLLSSLASATTGASLSAQPAAVRPGDALGEQRKTVAAVADKLRDKAARAAVKQRLDTLVSTLRADTAGAPPAKDGVIAVRVVGSPDASSGPVPLPQLTAKLVIGKTEVSTDVTDVTGCAFLALGDGKASDGTTRYVLRILAGDGSEVGKAEGDTAKDRSHLLTLGPSAPLAPNLAIGSAWMKAVAAVEDGKAAAAKLVERRLGDHAKALDRELTVIDRNLARLEKLR